MIGRIAGIVLHRAADQVLIDVRGVGYIVQVSERTAAGLPPVGQAAALYTDLVVREDLLQLIGFSTMIEKEWHRLLTSVQGVGARASLAILGALGAEGLGRAIALGDAASLRRAPGVGPKLAARVVMELKDKAPAIMALGGVIDTPPAVVEDSPVAAPMPRPAAPPSDTMQAQAEALSALANLGYAPAEAASAVAEAAGSDPSAATPALIRAALRLLAPKG